MIDAGSIRCTVEALESRELLSAAAASAKAATPPMAPAAVVKPAKKHRVTAEDSSLGDVTAHVTVSVNRQRYSASSGVAWQTVTFTNTSGGVISGPFDVAVHAISRGALVSPTGVTQSIAPLGDPFVYLQTAPATIAPGGTLSVLLQFSGTKGKGVRYAPRLIADPLEYFLDGAPVTDPTDIDAGDLTQSTNPNAPQAGSFRVLRIASIAADPITLDGDLLFPDANDGTSGSDFSIPAINLVGKSANFSLHAAQVTGVTDPDTGAVVNGVDYTFLTPDESAAKQLTTSDPSIDIYVEGIVVGHRATGVGRAPKRGKAIKVRGRTVSL